MAHRLLAQKPCGRSLGTGYPPFGQSPLQTEEDISDKVEGWWLWERYSQEVLDGLKKIDTRFEAIKAENEAARQEKQQMERDLRTAILLVETAHTEASEGRVEAAE